MPRSTPGLIVNLIVTEDRVAVQAATTTLRRTYVIAGHGQRLAGVTPQAQSCFWRVCGTDWAIRA